MSNYGGPGNQALNYHYQTDFISSYQNKLLYNVFEPGVVNNYNDAEICNVDGITSTEDTYIKINYPLSLFIEPNNRNSSTPSIITAFNSLSTLDQTILESQILKCDTTSNIIIERPTGSTNQILYLNAEFSWLEDEVNSVVFDFSTSLPSNNIINILTVQINASGNISSITYGEQTQCLFNSNIDIEVNVDLVNGRHAGNDVGNVAVSNLVLNSSLNAEMLDGYTSSQLGIKNNINNVNLNAEYIGTGNISSPTLYTPNSSGVIDDNRIPLSAGSGILNQYLNANYLNGETQIPTTTHDHRFGGVDTSSGGGEIIDGATYIRVGSVNASNLVMHNSFETSSITKDKIESGALLTDATDGSSPATGSILRVECGRLALGNTRINDASYPADASGIHLNVRYTFKRWTLAANYTEQPKILLDFDSPSHFLSNNQFLIYTISVKRIGAYWRDVIITVRQFNMGTQRSNWLNSCDTDIIFDWVAIGPASGAF